MALSAGLKASEIVFSFTAMETALFDRHLGISKRVIEVTRSVVNKTADEAIFMNFGDWHRRRRTSTWGEELIGSVSVAGTEFNTSPIVARSRLERLSEVKEPGARWHRQDDGRVRSRG